MPAPFVPPKQPKRADAQIEGRQGLENRQLVGIKGTGDEPFSEMPSAMAWKPLGLQIQKNLFRLS